MYNQNLYLIRHGETEYNKAHIIQGHVDSPLTERGISQAKTAAEELTQSDIDVIICSDLGRAVETAEIIGKKINTPIAMKTPLIRERHWGSMEGVQAEKVRGEYPQYVMEDGLLILEHDFPTAEPLMNFYDRIVTGIGKLMEEFMDKKVLMVGHKGVLNMMFAYKNKIPLEKVRQIYNPDNCTIEIY